MSNQSQKGFISVLLILLVILVVVGGIFYYGITKGNLLKTSDSNLDTTHKFDEQLNSSNKVDTSNWKTYVSKKYNYSIMYPQDSEFIVCQEDCYKEALLKNDNLQIYFGGSGIPNLTPIQNVADNGFCHAEKGDVSQKTSIHSIDFYTSRKDYAPDNICLYAITKLKEVNFETDPNAYYTIDLQAKTTNEAGAKLFNQILSTFNFLPTIDTQKDEPVVLYPGKNEKIISPLLVKGIAPSSWLFEGQLVIKILDEDKRVIAHGTAKEDKSGNWSSGKPIAFEGSIPFSTTAKSGFLIIENDNPSGLPENQKRYEIPVSF